MILFFFSIFNSQVICVQIVGLLGVDILFQDVVRNNRVVLGNELRLDYMPTLIYLLFH